MSLFSFSKTFLSHQRELCPQPRLGLWWGSAVMSSECSVTLKAAQGLAPDSPVGMG